jgi:hypothetical protein
LEPLLQVAQATDPKPWRKQLWDVLAPADGKPARARLVALARSEDALALPPVGRVSAQPGEGDSLPMVKREPGEYFAQKGREPPGDICTCSLSRRRRQLLRLLSLVNGPHAAVSYCPFDVVTAKLRR